MTRTNVLSLALWLATIAFGAVWWQDTQQRITALEERVTSDYRLTLTTTLSPWQVKSEALRDEAAALYWEEVLKMMKRMK